MALLRRRGRLLALGLFVCAVVAAGGQSARASVPRFHLFARTEALPIADGVRYVALRLGPDATSPVRVVRIVDSARGKAFDEAAPTVSVSWSSDPQPCVAQAIGGGKLLWGCASQNRGPNVLIEDLATRHFSRAAGLDALRPDSLYPDRQDYFVAIGRYWLRGEESYSEPHSVVSDFFLNWRTGEIRFPPGPNHFRDDHVEDLDTPGLERPLCRPLRRHRIPVENSAGPTGSYTYTPYLYDGSHAAYLTPSGDLRLARCGQRRTVSLASSYPDAVLGGGWLTYTIPYDRIQALRLTDGRAYEWGIEEAGLPYGTAHVTHTASRLLATYCDLRSDPHADHCAIYSASLPRARSHRKHR